MNALGFEGLEFVLVDVVVVAGCIEISLGGFSRAGVNFSEKSSAT